MDRTTEEVKLSDGRVVVMQDLTGADQLVASRIVNAKDQGDFVAMTATLTCLGIQSIDGKPFARPARMTDVQLFMAGIRMRDLNKLQTAFGRLNGDDSAGEAPAAE